MGGISNILGSLMSLLPFSKGGIVQTKDGLYKVSVKKHTRGMPRKVKAVRSPDTFNTMKEKNKSMGIPTTIKRR